MPKHLFPAYALLCSASVLAQDGALDADFSADGMQFTAAGDYLSRAYDVAQLPDGYLLVAGEASAALSESGIAVVKYVPDGEPDATFGEDGIAYMQPGTGHQWCYGMALQEDGGIVLAGGTQETAAQIKLLLVRLLPDGGLDPSFGDDGIARLALGTGGSTAYDVALQPDGKIVAVGQLVNGGTNDLFVARVNADGSWDTDFGGGDGWTTLDLAGGGGARAVALDDAGNIVVGGIATTGLKLLAARLLPDGGPDNSFDGDGIRLIDVDISIADISMVLDGDGIVLCSHHQGALVVPRLNSDGGDDLSWGNDGLADITNDGWMFIGKALALQADGKLVIAGRADGRPVLWRVGVDGHSDPDFGPGGMGFIRLQEMEGNSGYNAVLIQQDHRIVAAGDAVNGSVQFFTARHHSGVHVGIDDAVVPAVQAALLPNPVHDRCELTFGLDRADRLSAMVQDAQGRAVRTLFSNEPFAAGSQRRTVDLSGLAPGMYVLVLSNADGRVASTRLIEQ